MDERTGKILKCAACILTALYFGAAVLAVAGMAVLRSDRLQAPEQPIDFPHTVHVGQLGLACTYCHIHVEDSPEAGVPPLEICMGCHRSVAVDRPEVRKLIRSYEQKKPVEWIKVHDLPDFIYFSHKRHVRAEVDCSACHGDVAKMDRIKRVRPLRMGWCIGCHRALGASTDCATCHL